MSRWDPTSRACSDVVTFEDFAPVVDALEAALGAAGGTLFRYGERDGPTLMPGSLARTMEGYSLEHFAADPIHPFCRTIPTPRFVVPHPPFELGAWERSFAYRDFYAPRDIDRCFALWLTDRRYQEPGCVGLLFVQPRGREFDTAGIDCVREPLRLAARRALRTAQLVESVATLEELLSRGAAGVDATWSTDGRLLWNSAAFARVDPVNARAIDEAARGWATSITLRERARPIPATHYAGPGLVASFWLLERGDSTAWVCASLETTTLDRAPVEALSPAESTILAALAAGARNPDLAQMRGVSPETIKTQLKRLFLKLGVRTRTQAVLRARDLGLLPRTPRT